DVADQGDELAVEVIDAEIAGGGLGGALHHDSAGRVEATDLDIGAAALSARISHGQARRLQRQLGLGHVDVAGEDRAVGAVLDLDPVGRDVYRGVAVVALERGYRLFLAHLRRGRARETAYCKDDAN